MNRPAESIDAKLARVTARIMGGKTPSIDLTDRKNWHTKTDKNGRLIENVVFSVCGRFTIVRYPGTGSQTPTYSAFRRHGPPNEVDWSPPEVLGNHPSADAAREDCARYVEPEARR
jgi:hypothetical protein